MKKHLLLCIFALSITSCNFSSLVHTSKSYEFEENSEAVKKDHSGIYLNFECTDQLLVKETPDTGNDYSPKLTIATNQIGATTIKRLDGQITFYKDPVFLEEQLEEIDNNVDRPERYYFEQQIVFKDMENKAIDFVYFKDIQFSSKNPDSKLYKCLRLAIFDKETNSDYYVLSYEKNGLESKTTYQLDLNADGKLDNKTKYAFEDDQGPANYTTGLPAYYTDSYELCIPTERDIEQDNIQKLMSLMDVKNSKPLTIRMWVEGWELDNNDSGLPQIDINLKFAAHYKK